ELVRQATDARARAAQGAEEVEARRRRLREAWAATPEHAGLPQKEPLWAEEEAVAMLERGRDEHEGGAVRALEAALRLQPDVVSVRDELATLHLARRARFLGSGHRERALEEERRAIEAGGPELERTLRASGTLVVYADAELALAQFVEDRGRLRLRGLRELSAGVAHELAPGSYRLRTDVDGRLVVLPLEIAPEQVTRITFEPRDAARLPADMVLVHRGVSLVGGDTAAPSRVEIGSFGLAVYPVTCGEYLEFLRTAFASPHEALRLAPRPSHDAGSYWRVVDGAIAMPSVDTDGDRWDPRFPVFGISALDAEAYLTWRSARDGRSYRLPSEVEWERAARGADGRVHPWGDRFDPALCKMRSSRAGDFTPEIVGAFPTDVSPFGVRDLAGGIAEWTSTAYGDDSRARCVKGGAWSTRAHRCAASFRASMLEHHVSGDLGFRLASDV
ncbi:MAG: formylglycine-generating enzyme family protein, partial [Sandaracinaceae bacterium]|nr:formylglycine-generating enzyme family protein [Sandaracinaceae bacterium]